MHMCACSIHVYRQVWRQVLGRGYHIYIYICYHIYIYIYIYIHMHQSLSIYLSNYLSIMSIYMYIHIYTRIMCKMKLRLDTYFTYWSQINECIYADSYRHTYVHRCIHTYNSSEWEHDDKTSFAVSCSNSKLLLLLFI